MFKHLKDIGCTPLKLLSAKGVKNMPNIKSAKKRVKVQAKKAANNKATNTALKTAIKKAKDRKSVV